MRMNNIPKRFCPKQASTIEGAFLLLGLCFWARTTHSEGFEQQPWYSEEQPNDVRDPVQGYYCEPIERYLSNLEFVKRLLATAKNDSNRAVSEEIVARFTVDLSEEFWKEHVHHPDFGLIPRVRADVDRYSYPLDWFDRLWQRYGGSAVAKVSVTVYADDDSGDHLSIEDYFNKCGERGFHSFGIINEYEVK